MQSSAKGKKCKSKSLPVIAPTGLAEAPCTPHASRSIFSGPTAVPMYCWPWYLDAPHHRHAARQLRPPAPTTASHTHLSLPLLHPPTGLARSALSSSCRLPPYPPPHHGSHDARCASVPASCVLLALAMQTLHLRTGHGTWHQHTCAAAARRVARQDGARVGGFTARHWRWLHPVPASRHRSSTKAA